ncbi:prephenate dehydrogenase [Nesterenkonia populi]|uniref:prephenate dehydrogenase n=1 Tax=Nesterenkonia populi TaxID=1591087 RepID=UPI0011BEEFD0|nr:prephenate dehydrogenase [Nesterenkonia populi]
MSFQTVLIRGTGLLGASIGLGLRAAGKAVWLSDPSGTAMRIAEDIGAGSPWPADEHPDLVVVAAPPEATAEEVHLALVQHPEAIVVDIASVKGSILEELHQIQEGLDLSRYVGTHPMAGRERSGPVAARGALFTSMPWVICPHETAEASAVAEAEELARLLGASLHRMGPAEHDESVALISHLPQVAASLVASRLQDAPGNALELSGNGLRDVTRIAASDPNLWVQILTHNASAVLEILYGLSEDVSRLIGTLESPRAPGGQADIAQLIAEGNAGVARIPGKHGTPPQSFTVVTVIVDDRPGQIAAVLNDVAEAGVNVEDMRMDHSAGHQVGMVELSVLPGRAEELAQALTHIGWKVVLT